jgi:hypothetical protein
LFQQGDLSSGSNRNNYSKLQSFYLGNMAESLVFDIRALLALDVSFSKKEEYQHFYFLHEDSRQHLYILLHPRH